MDGVDFDIFPKATSSDYIAAEKLIYKGIIDSKRFGDISIGTNIWKCGPQNNRMWLWTLHALVPIDPLLATEKYFEAKILIDSWIKEFSCSKVEDEFPWHDHATALRLDRLSSIQLRYSDCDYSSIAIKHADLLLQEDFYSENTNHGFDQALSLILASFAFSKCKESETWQKIGIKRLKAEIEFAFTKEGVHVENSPAYHMGMIANLVRARDLLKYVTKEDFNFKDLFNKTILFLSWITRPDRYLAYIGDSASYRPSIPDSLKHLESAEFLKWIISSGLQGKKPNGNFMVYPEAGYAIYRSNWTAWPGHTHLIMKCGFLSRYHRQDDDLNVLIHAFGEDWLIDSGLYNHNQSDPIRVYMRSSLAHNIPYIPGKRTNRSQLGRNFSSIDQCDAGDYLYAVEGESQMYGGVKIKRKLMIKNEREFRILDRFNGAEKSEKYWLFHFPLDKKIKHGGGKAVVSGKKADLILRSNIKSVNSNIYKGMNEDFPSVFSKNINSISESQVLVFGPCSENQIVFSMSFVEK
ncbi:MAG: heparinase II/III domain-containing protein [Alcaligenes sp.]